VTSKAWVKLQSVRDYRAPLGTLHEYWPSPIHPSRGPGTGGTSFTDFTYVRAPAAAIAPCDFSRLMHAEPATRHQILLILVVPQRIPSPVVSGSARFDSALAAVP